MWAWPLHSSPTSPRTNTGEEENYPSTPLFYTLLAKDLRDEVFRGTVDTPPHKCLKPIRAQDVFEETVEQNYKQNSVVLAF